MLYKIKASGHACFCTIMMFFFQVFKSLYTRVTVFSSRYLSVSTLMHSEVPTKKARLDMSIGTHNGTFHCDEVLAVWMLKTMPKYRDAKIVRTRDPESLAKCDIVVDVGAVFDHSSLRYDHHQRDFVDTYNSLDSTKPWRTKLSSAGLIFVHYCKEVVKSVMEKVASEQGRKLESSDHQVALIADQIYENLIEEVDAVDNGISVSDELPKYKITTTISKRVGNLNPFWNVNASDDQQMERFEKAMELVGEEFVDRVRYYQLAWLPAHSLVKEAVTKRFVYRLCLVWYACYL